MKHNNIQKSRGFTLIELVITIAIFAAMTTYLLAKYGKFNQSLLLTNLAYDVALTIRTAQSYGLNVKSVSTSSTNPANFSFSFPYGVHFDTSSPNNASFIFFADQDVISSTRFGDGIYDAAGGSGSVDEKISLYTIKRGSYISDICVKNNEDDECESANELDITFRRPDPDAIILAEAQGDSTISEWKYAEVTLLANDGITKKVIIVRSTGQIAITD